MRKLSFILIGSILFAFQNCAPPLPKSDDGTDSCNEESATIITSQLNADRFGVLTLESGDELYVIEHDLVRISPDGTETVVPLGPFCSTAMRQDDGEIFVGGYVIAGNSAEFIGCDLKISSGCAPKIVETNSSEPSSSRSSGRSRGSSQEARQGPDDRRGGDGSGSRLQYSGGSCGDLSNRQIGWEQYKTTVVRDPACQNVRRRRGIRFIETVYEREIRCDDGTKVPTGKTRKSEKRTGRC